MLTDAEWPATVLIPSRGGGVSPLRPLHNPIKMSKLLHEALSRATVDPMLEDLAGMTSDSDQETPVHSRPPSRHGGRSKMALVHESSLDPLQRLPKHIACRAFLYLDESDLKTLRRVSKRYNQSVPGLRICRSFALERT